MILHDIKEIDVFSLVTYTILYFTVHSGRYVLATTAQ